jgi:hypothetical protein
MLDGGSEIKAGRTPCSSDGNQSGIIIAVAVRLRRLVAVDAQEEEKPHERAELQGSQEGIYPINLKLKQGVEAQTRPRRTHSQIAGQQPGLPQDDPLPGHHLLRQPAEGGAPHCAALPPHRGGTHLRREERACSRRPARQPLRPRASPLVEVVEALPAGGNRRADGQPQLDPVEGDALRVR